METGLLVSSPFGRDELRSPIPSGPQSHRETDESSFLDSRYSSGAHRTIIYDAPGSFLPTQSIPKESHKKIGFPSGHAIFPTRVQPKRLSLWLIRLKVLYQALLRIRCQPSGASRPCERGPLVGTWTGGRAVPDDVGSGIWRLDAGRQSCNCLARRGGRRLPCVVPVRYTSRAHDCASAYCKTFGIGSRTHG